MSNIRTYACLLCAAALSLASASYGATTTYSGTLDGLSENPPVATVGSGTAAVTYDSTAQTLQVSVTFTGLIGTSTAAHIHCCVAPPGNAGVAVPFPGFPVGVTSGNYIAVLDLTQAATYNGTYLTNSGGTPASAEAALAAGLSGGMAYVNIHTTFAPGGEIRSFLEQQLDAIPAASTAGLAALALLVAAAGAVLLLRRH